MRLRPAIVFCLFPLSVMPASAQDHSDRIFGAFTGRFHCSGQWRDFQLHMAPVSGPLGIVDDEDDLTASITFYFYRSVTSKPVENMVDSPKYVAWKKFPPGAAVTHEDRLLHEYIPGEQPVHTQQNFADYVSA